MADRIWNEFLTEQDKQVFEKSGFGAEAGYGERPALLVIDVSYNFCGDKREPILESIKRFHNSCGEYAWDALPHIRKLIDKCHEKGIPVIYTTGTVREDGWDAGGWAWKNSRTEEDVTAPNTADFNRDGNDIMDEIAPSPEDIVIRKHKPSAFYGTPLSGFLNDLGADSLLVTGTTTSGCIRASVIDAFSNNYRVAVVEEGCFDRSQASHAINLCDMHAKYADVVTTEQALKYVDGLDVDMNVPTGSPL
ncbi:MAG: hydrolase [Rhodospirillaceae bacterium]|nr:hydrolase [Rhodospirillaceae bacterium]|tara:strand:- start:40177 stop:40923 length:747 start_codon:yes stop_codon:yes gene_type:complete